MHQEAFEFEKYDQLQDETCAQRIVAAKSILGKRAVILAHHYQRADVYRHADLTGDSLKLSYLAAQTDADFLVF
ncbi:MAG: quinolinate synthase NadA, partial [Nitrosomonas sp.]|nr:quinolinate synthase NadA [Nitrosomonas sp.]